MLSPICLDEGFRNDIHLKFISGSNEIDILTILQRTPRNLRFLKLLEKVYYLGDSLLQFLS